MKILVAASAAGMMVFGSGCAANPPAAPLIPPSESDAKSRVTKDCGPYHGSESALVQIKSVAPIAQKCDDVTAMMRKFMESEGANSPMGRGIVAGWDCQSYGSVKAALLGSWAVCQQNNTVAILVAEKTEELPFP